MAQMCLDQFDEAAKTARTLSEIESPEVAIMREMDALMAQEKFQAVIELYAERSLQFLHSKMSPMLFVSTQQLCFVR